ncbi:MAG TPA: peptidylprolyl isomerase [Acidimicrobiales bacterium]|nr:peptidylprolyl isomerase [Acidimicrobiales bacterium]
MPTEKRRRQKEGRQARLAAQQASRRRAQRKRRLVTAVVVSLVVFGLLLLLSGNGDDPAEHDVATGEGNGAFEYGTGECPPEAKPEEPVRQFDDAPQRCIEEGVDYAAVLTTSEGEITVDLLEDTAPGTVNNFVVLARYGYYDGTLFHRVIPGFVVQGGSPPGVPAGTGGPGYTIPDELPASVDDYTEGSVAMANAGADTGGSQFFIYLGPNPLPGPKYSLFGNVTEGLEVAKAIEDLGSPSGQPRQEVTLESVEIVER